MVESDLKFHYTCELPITIELYKKEHITTYFFCIETIDVIKDSDARKIVYIYIYIDGLVMVRKYLFKTFLIKISQRSVIHSSYDKIVIAYR